MNTTDTTLVGAGTLTVADIAALQIPKPGTVTFNRARREITKATPAAEKALILRARARAKEYYTAAILKTMGTDRLYVWMHIFGFEPTEETLLFRRTWDDNRLWEDTTFQKRELEAL